MIDARSPIQRLERMFAGQVENALFAELGLADPELAEYLAALLARFVHVDSIFPPDELTGRRVEGIAAMLEQLADGEAPASLRSERDVHRHIGDFTLFWSGLYPEAIHGRRHVGGRRDALLDYTARGKQSYMRAAQLSFNGGDDPPRDLLRRLSARYELCARGLELVGRRLRPRKVKFGLGKSREINVDRPK